VRPPNHRIGNRVAASVAEPTRPAGLSQRPRSSEGPRGEAFATIAPHRGDLLAAKTRRPIAKRNAEPCGLRRDRAHPGGTATKARAARGQEVSVASSW